MNSLKIAVLFVSATLFFVSCRHKKQLVVSKEGTVKTSTESAVQAKLGLTKKEVKASKLYSYIDEWYGVPYKYGGCQKTGVDCSCFASNLYEKVYGFRTPRTAGEIYKECDRIKKENLKEGDLLFFIINGKNVSHVGVYLMKNKFVHSSTSKGVIISDLDESYYKKYFYAAGRLKHSM